MNVAVFLDRDNTLIHNDGDLGDPDQVRLIQGAASAVASLCGLGYKVIVVTNQGGVARGKYTEAEVDAVHERIRDLVQTNSTGATIDRFYYCPYHPKGTVKQYKKEHPWRKPKPGMLLQAAKDLDLDLAQCWIIGDQVRDVHAGAAAGVRTILLRDRNISADHDEDDDGAAPINANVAAPNFIARNLIEAVRIVAQQRKPDSIEDIHADEPASPRWTAAAAAAIKRQHSDVVPPTNPMVATVQPIQTTAQPHRAARPFRPWNTPASRDEKDDQPYHKHIAEEPMQTSLSNQSVVTAQAPAAPVKQPKPAKVEQPPVAKTDPTPTQPPKPAPVEVTLRQILQELRNQRGTTTEFSYLSVLAIVLQMVALVCLLGALLLGRTEEALFIRWLGAGLLVQLATIATLLFSR